LTARAAPAITAAHVTPERIIRAFELEALVVFLIVGAVVVRQSRRAGALTPLGALFVGGLAVAFFGDPVANWGLTALYSDQFHLLPRWMGWGLSPAQSWACVFAYPWCFPMLAYAGRWIARRLGFTSALAGFVCGAIVGLLNFVLSVPMTFVPNQVIVYQQAPPWPLTLWAGTPAQVQLLDVLGITVFVGVLAALLMPAPGASRLERWLPAGSLARAGFGAALMVGLFLVAFSPALAVRALGLDTEVAYRRSPYPTVPLYGQMEGYSPQVVENFLSACMKNSDARTCRCALDAVRRRFTIDEYRALEARIAQRDVPRELLAALDDCRH
jgi:hypothetical protein